MRLTQRSGQTLLEMVIAIGIIIVSTLATTGLIITTITAGRVSQNRVEAANFAREGIEVIRSIRDTNYLRRDQNVLETDTTQSPAINAPVQWDDSGLLGDGYLPLDCSIAPAGASSYVASDVAGSWSLIGGPATPCAAAFPPTADQVRIRQAERTIGGIVFRFFTQTCSAGYTCVDTKYSRTIDITKHSGTALPDVDLGEATAIGTIEYLDVVSTVTWRDRTGAKSLVAQERLYNWR